MTYTKLMLVFCVFISITTKAQNWNQTMKHIASIRSNTGQYGFSISIDGNYAVVGALAEATDASGSNLIANAGAAYVLQLINGNWVEIKKIVAPDRALNDNFANSISISDNIIAVACSNQDKDANGANPMNSSGAVYLYSKDAGGVNNWGFIKKIIAPDRAPDDFFGQSVSVNNGNLLVGASAEDEDATGANFITLAGSAYIFNIDAGGVGNWGLVKKIVASDRAAVDQFGYNVSISGDVAVVSAFQEDQDANGLNTLSNAGSAYVFYKNQGGANNWGQVKKVVPLDRGAGDFFGNSVALNGNILAIGAFQEDHDIAGGAPQSNAGSAYVFGKDEGGVDNWGQIKKLVANDRITNDFFGRSIAVNSNTIVVGAITEDEDTNGANTISNSGSAYVFTKDQGGVNNWGQAKKLTASDRGAEDFFGISVAVNNGNVLVGSFQEDENLDVVNTITDAGAVYAFKGTCTSFPLAAPFTTVLGNQEAIPTAYYDGNCALVATIAPQGAVPIYAHTLAKVWVDGIQNVKYVNRHYEVKTFANANIATGKITLFCTQPEINNFNTVSTYDLPTNGADAIGISNIRIRKFYGTSTTGTGSQTSYTGASILINPADTDIVWNANNSRWEITFVDSAFGGYFIEAPPPNINTTGNIVAFTTCAGIPSVNQSFVVNASFLLGPVTITAPTGFEISTLPNAGFSNTVLVAPIAGAVNTTIYIRLNSALSATPSGSITLTATGANTITIAVTGVANPPSLITTEPVNSNVCFGNNGSFYITATGVNLTYQWQLSNGATFTNITGATSAYYSIPLPPSNNNFNGSLYRCIVGSVCSPDTSNIVSLNISPTPSITLTATKLNLTPGQTTILTATTNSTGGVFTWYKNDVPSVLAIGNSYGPLTIAQIGSYKATYTNTAGCSATSFPVVIAGAPSVKLWIYPNPNNGKFNFRYYNQTNDRGRVVIYNNTGKKVYESGFISGTTYSENKVNISNQPAGIYTVAVTNIYSELLYQTQIVVAR